MKQLIKLSLLLLAFMLPASATAYNFYVDGIFYNIIDNEASVTFKDADFNSYTNNVIIPSTVSFNGNTFSVTAIGDCAFIHCSGLTSINIPNSIITIGDGAFSDCTGLTSVTIGNSVTTIGSSAFSGCSGLTSVTIPNSVTTIGDYAFSRCSGLTSVTIPNSVTTIGDNAFARCTGLTSVNIPYGVTSIGYYAFENCTSLTSIDIPNSVKAIGNNAFSNTAWYNNQPDGVVYAGLVAYGYKGTMPDGTNISLRDGTLGIAQSAFYGCTGLTSINIPNSVTTIGSRAFNNTAWYNNQPDGVVYAGLVAYGYKGTMPDGTNISLRDGTLGIAQSAFYGCTALTSINIPNSVSYIGDWAFYGCSGLTSIKVSSSNTKYDSRNNCNAIIETSSNTLIAGCKNTIIPNSVTAIGNSAFDGCSGLTSINIPNSVTTIGSSAFSGCSGLTSITIPDSVTTIGSSAFSYCTRITNVTIGRSVRSIGIFAFETCIGLTDLIWNARSCPTYGEMHTTSIERVTIGDEVVYLPGGFASKSKIATVTIPNSLISIGDYAFDGCVGLNSVNIPNSVIYIGDNAFNGCSGLTSIDIPNSITYIGEGAFDRTPWFNNLPNGLIYLGSVLYAYKGTMPANTSITIKEGTTSITGAAFSCYEYLTDINIPNSVIYIGDNAFECCFGLTNVNLGNSVTYIGNYAFEACGMTSINIPNSVSYIGMNAFAGTRLTSVNIPNSVAIIGYLAFGYCGELANITVAGGNSRYDSRNNCNAIIETANNTLIVGCMNTIIPNSVTTIGGEAFSSCIGLTNITIPNSVITIGGGAFEYCTGLTSVTIPNSVTSIGNYAFSGCSGLTNITIPNSVITIGGGAFEYCTGLTSVTIPNSVTTIGGWAFRDCTGLTNITCLATTPPTLAYSNVFDSSTYSSATLKAPQSSISAYQSADYWKNFTNIQGLADVFKVDGIYYHTQNYSTATVIPNPEGEGYYQGDVVIPDSITTQDLQFRVTGIDNGAFDGCDELNSVVIGNAVETIGEEAFQGCTGLTSVTIGNGVTSIGQRAFNYCNALQTVTCLGTVPPVMANSNCFSSAAYRKATLKVHRNYIDTYTATNYWYKFENIEGFGSVGLGDANGDGDINISDVTSLIDRLLGKDTDEFYFESADLNGNGHLDIGDVVTLIDLLLWNN